MTSESSVNTDRFLKAFEIISGFEKGYAAQDWQYNGFHVWPIAKYVLVKQMMFAMARGHTPSSRLASYPRHARKRRLRTGLPALFKSPVNHANSISALPTELMERHNYWCLGTGSGFVDLNGSMVSQHHHALRTALLGKGHLSLGLYSGFDPGRLPAHADYGPQASLDPFIASVPEAALVPRQAETYLRRHFNGLDTVIKAAGHTGIELFSLIDTLVGRVDFTISCFSEVLKTTQPKAVFTSNYASFYGWAMAYLCRKHAIHFVDVQHGVQGRFNGSYFYERTPETDWSILPGAHLCWSRSDADLFLGHHPDRAASVVGPTWFQFAEFLKNQTETTKKSIARFRNRGGPLVLFAGQNAEDILIAKRLHDEGLNILFRAHPLRRGESEQLVSATDVAALGCSLAADAPLPHLLDAIDGVVTGHSAVLLEGCLKGVSCLATGEFARFLRADYEKETDGLLTVEPAVQMNEKVSVILRWAKSIDCGRPRKAAAMRSFSDALEDLIVPL